MTANVLNTDPQTGLKALSHPYLLNFLLAPCSRTLLSTRLPEPPSHQDPPQPFLPPPPWAALTHMPPIFPLISHPEGSASLPHGAGPCCQTARQPTHLSVPSKQRQPSPPAWETTIHHVPPRVQPHSPAPPHLPRWWLPWLCLRAPGRARSTEHWPSYGRMSSLRSCARMFNCPFSVSAAFLLHAGFGNVVPTQFSSPCPPGSWH